MKRILPVFLILSLFLISGCSAAYQKYSQRIAVSATPKEIFDIDIELRFVSATSVEKKEMKKRLAQKGLQVFTGYTRGMIQGTVIADRQFIASIRNFVINYKPYVNNNDKQIFDEILKALDELDLYLDRIEGQALP